MVRRGGRHAADDGSFGRSAGTAALRGAALLAVAVVLGIILLQASDNNDAFDTPVVAGQRSSQPTSSPNTTRAPVNTTTTVALRAAAQVKVLAANGTTVKGLAGRIKDRLSAAGYNALAPTDASKKPQAVSTVYFAAGYEGEARVIGQLLKINDVKPLPTPPPVASVQGANIVVMVGQDNAGAATTATTRRSSTAATTTSTSRPKSATTSTTAP